MYYPSFYMSTLSLELSRYISSFLLSIVDLCDKNILILPPKIHHQLQYNCLKLLGLLTYLELTP